ncbi:helix-turn-helix domain-containing protein [Umezawaea tangerina]|uniref:Helix-turn-helix protein n=1 Tax=Umezawaea tangerina TaxID=84725 RepID=A0A2T0TCB4_9PSEU|nr:helix-turn-helix domain-containing protein [Umezawaea tangerina]PRY43295.1 helix-turn-helix protein [Umezawaea tangerina]
MTIPDHQHRETARIAHVHPDAVRAMSPDDIRCQPEPAEKDADVRGSRTLCDAYVRSQWVRNGPLPVEVRDHLAAGFGARVRALRADRGWSQEKLAGLLGCDRRTVGRLELGQHRPTRQQCAWLAAALTPAGTSPMVLDHEFLGLVGERLRGKRKGSRSGLYTLPGQFGAELAAVLRQANRVRRLRMRSC